MYKIIVLILFLVFAPDLPAQEFTFMVIEARDDVGFPPKPDPELNIRYANTPEIFCKYLYERPDIAVFDKTGKIVENIKTSTLKCNCAGKFNTFHGCKHMIFARKIMGQRIMDKIKPGQYVIPIRDKRIMLVCLRRKEEV